MEGFNSCLFPDWAYFLARWNGIENAFRQLTENYDGTKNEITALRQEFEEFYRDFEKRLKYVNVADVLAHMVYPEINNDGFYVINIPGGWDTVYFNTTNVDITLPMQPEYGHLVISY